VHRILTEGRGSQSAFAGESDTPQAPRRGTTLAQIEEIFFQSYLKYFKNAEERRRWSIERDVPWDKTNPESSDLTADIVESFSAVEMYLPDYTHKIMELVRRSRGRALFQANWGYEESKHSLVLEEWLIRSGKRTEEQVRDFERALLGGEWGLPFETPRQMIIYTMVQEMATALNYTNLRRRAEEERDEALARVLRWVSSDESAHYNFFRKGVKAFLALEPEETIADIKWIFDHFAMPAHALIPGWDKRGAEIEAAGIYGPKMYLAKIRRPILEDLAITRTQLKDAGLPGTDADAIADQQEEAEIYSKQKVLNRFFSFAE
jgi:acyl-[acyl-carrier-protein] desaturase